MVVPRSGVFRPALSRIAGAPALGPAVLSATVESLSSGGVLRVAGARAITSRHPGCLELRKGKYPDCVFDGRFSLATRGSGETAGEMWLYARANMAPKGGGRSQRRCLLPSEELSSQS